MRSRKDQTHNHEQARVRVWVRKSRFPLHQLHRHPILVQLAFDVHPQAHARQTSPASACAPRPPSGRTAPPSSARASPPYPCYSRATALVIALARGTLGLARDQDLSAVAMAMRRRASLCVSPPSLPLLLYYDLHPHSRCHPPLDPRDWKRTGDPQAQAEWRSSSGSRWPCWRGGGARFVPYGSYGSCGGYGTWVRTYSSLVLLDQTHSSANATVIDVQRKMCSANSSLRTTARAGG